MIGCKLYDDFFFRTECVVTFFVALSFYIRQVHNKVALTPDERGVKIKETGKRFKIFQNVHVSQRPV